MEIGEKEGLVGKASKFVAGALPSLSASGLLAFGGAALAAIHGSPMGGMWQGAAMACAAAAAVGGLVRGLDKSSVKEAWGRATEGVVAAGGLAGGAAVAGLATAGLYQAGAAMFQMPGVAAAAGTLATAMAVPMAGLATLGLGAAAVGVSALEALSPSKQAAGGMGEKLAQRRKAKEEDPSQRPQARI